jgi:hypothetical protein
MDPQGTLISPDRATTAGGHYRRLCSSQSKRGPPMGNRIVSFWMIQ